MAKKTYQEKKEEIRQVAMEFQDTFAIEGYPWSWGGLMMMQDYFEKNAKRYGLLKEFRENAII